jgi:hypothetical protein
MMRVSIALVGLVLMCGGTAMVMLRRALDSRAGRFSERVGWTDYDSNPKVYLWTGLIMATVGFGWLLSAFIGGRS